MIWEVFRQQSPDRDFVYCRDVHAPDREMAKQFAAIQHGRRKPTHALWVVPQETMVTVTPADDIEAHSEDGTTMSWEVFLPNRQGYHTHCDTVSASGEADAKRTALEEYGDDIPGSRNLWLAPQQCIAEIDSSQIAFGGTTDKSYRFAQTYNVDPAAEEVEASEDEQIEAEQKRKRGDA